MEAAAENEGRKKKSYLSPIINSKKIRIFFKRVDHPISRKYRALEQISNTNVGLGCSLVLKTGEHTNTQKL